MKKIHLIGECSLNIIFGPDGQPAGAMPGGRIINATAILARAGLPAGVLSEAANDPVGQSIVDFLNRAGADTSAIDRFTGGRTPLNIFTAPTPDSTPAEDNLTRYVEYPDDEPGFDIVWPRVDEGDIVVFGGYYALDPRMRPHLKRFLDNAKSMRAVMVYLPGFLRSQAPNVTRVMTALLENLEIADILITRSDDLSLIFGIDAEDSCFRDHISFYCRSLINVNPACRTISYHSGRELSTAEFGSSPSHSLIWNAGIVAGVVEALFKAPFGPEGLEEPPASVREEILGQALRCAGQAVEGIESWQNCK